MIIQGIGVWIPKKKRLNSDWPKSFGKANNNSRARNGNNEDDISSQKVAISNERDDDEIMSSLSSSRNDRTFNDIRVSSDERIAKAMAPYLIKESQDPFLGVTERRVADSDETVSRSAGEAAKDALNDAGLRPSDVDVVIGHASVPDYIPSQVASSVAREIGCRDDDGAVLAFDIDAGCASAIVGLELAENMLSGDPNKVVLIVDSQLLTRVQPMHVPSSPGLGDGAAAFVVTSTRKSPTTRGGGLLVRSIVVHSHPEYSNAVAFIRGKNPSNPKWFEQSRQPLHLGSHETSKVKRLMQNTISFVIKTVEEASIKAGIEETSELDYLASAQPRGFIPVVAAQLLGMRKQGAAVSTYEVLGHLGGVGFVTNLYEARRRGLLNMPGTKVACYAQGAGFVRAAAILEVVPPSTTTELLRSSL